MSDHLPECHRWFANMPEDGCPACEMFRACEQRVANKIAALRGEEMTHDPLCRNQNDPDPKCHACHLIDMARQDERERTLDAARKAVLAVEPFSMLPLLLKTYNALAAIDALKDKYTTDQGGMPK